MDTTAVGDGPIAFFTDEGQQILVPLSAISFDGDTVKSRVSITGLDDWLKYLVAQGRLAPGPAPAAANAMVFTAAAAGSTGNGIKVTVSENARDPAKVDVQVTETDVYHGLTLGNLATRLADSGGLVRADVPPNAHAPAEARDVSGTLDGAGIPTWTIPDGAGATSFTLTARGASSAPVTLWTISVTDVGPPAAVDPTFTLTVTWTKTVEAVGTAADLAALPAQLAFAVKITPPAGGFKLPRTGTVTLRGGAEPAEATSAAATVLAGA